jgi:drug/metabolite transporter (DMT)-like permease
MSDLQGEAAALLTAMCWSFTAMFFSYSGRRIGSDVVNRSRLLLAVALYAATHWLVFGNPMPSGTDGARFGWLALSALLGLVLGDSALFKSFVLVGPRLAMLMMALVPIISTVLAWILLGQVVTPLEMAGIGLTVVGISWVVTETEGRPTRGDVRSFRLGIMLGIAGAVGQASGLIAAERGLVGDFPALTASYVRILVAAVVMWGVAAWRGRAADTISKWRDRPAFGSLAAGTVVGPFIGVSLSLYAIQNTQVGVAATLMALAPVFLIPLGYIAYRERVSSRGAIGTGIAFAGVALILLPT